MISQEQLSLAQEYLHQKMSTLSQKSLEESTLRLLNAVSPHLPERVRMPFLCVAYFGFFHLYLAAVLVFTAGLFVRHQFNRRLSPRLQQLSWFEPACQKVHLWLLMAYHGLLSLILMPSLEPSPVTEDELIEGLEEKMEEYEVAVKEEEMAAKMEGEKEAEEKSEELKTEDMFQGMDEADFATVECSVLAEEVTFVLHDDAFLLDADADLTMRE